MKRKTAARIAAVGITAGLLGGVTAPAAVAQEHGSLSRVGACIAEKKALDVIIMIDETESLIHEARDGAVHRDRPGADVEHHRVPAAQSFIDELVAKQRDGNLETRVRVAGFGQEYKAGATESGDYGDWAVLDQGSADATKKLIAAFADRTSEQYTNYARALDGAYQDFSRSGSEDPCRMVVTFTDGALTAAEGIDVAEAALCSPGGVTDRLRGANITNIGIGLSAPHNPSDFSLFQGITEATGQQCGQLPPNGAFFTADNVGGLFAAFREALATGGENSAETRAGDPFRFVLDDSISSVRFTAIAKDDLGPDAHLVLTAPDGRQVEFHGTGEQEIHSSDVTWEAGTEPVQKADGTLTRRDGGSWAGPWTLQFRGFEESAADGRVFNSVEIQPDLRVEFSSGAETGNGLHLRDDDNVHLRLVDRDGNTRPLEGEALLDLTFVGPDGGDVVLAGGLDFSAGEIDVPLDAISSFPAIGSLQASTVITTRGDDAHPGTRLSPILNTTHMTVTQRDMPQLPAEIRFRAEEETVTVDVPVTGPGRVWIPSGSEIDASTLPDGVTGMRASSVHDSPDTALVLQLDEQGILPVELSASELRDGFLSGTLPVAVSNLEGANETVADVPTQGDLSVPLDQGRFLAAFLAALFLSLLIPLLLLYAVRWWSAKIPGKSMGALRIPVEFENGLLTYQGRNRPEIDPVEVGRNQILHNDRRITADGYTVEVKSFQLNPFASPVALVGQAPSISGDGRQTKGHAKLPVAVQNQWFLAARPGAPTKMDLVILAGNPLQDGGTALVNDILKNAPVHAETLAQQMAEAADAPQSPQGPSGPGKPTGPAGPQSPPTPPSPPSGPDSGGFGSSGGGFGSSGGGFGSSGGGFGSTGGTGGSGGGFGSSGGGFGSSGGSGGFGSSGGGFGSPGPGGFGS